MEKSYSLGLINSFSTKQILKFVLLGLLTSPKCGMQWVIN